MEVMTFAIIKTISDFNIPYKSHNNTPILNIKNIFKEMPSTFFVL